MNIIAKTNQWVAIAKECGDHVHPPEDKRYRVPKKNIVLYKLRNFLGQHVFPVHRLDSATSGVLLMALQPDAASKIAQQFQGRTVQKTYHAVARGWPPLEGTIDRPLASDSTGELLDSITQYQTMAQVQHPNDDPKVPHRKYSLLEMTPLTGRFHQIRRHLNRISHPVIGDNRHGDYRHNRYFRDHLGIEGLCLKAHRLGFFQPEDNQWIEITAPDNPQWEKIRTLFQCPQQQVDALTPQGSHFG